MNPVAEKPDNQEPVRVVEIGVKGLFGLYDHTVKLKDERVTIIHGPNGVGKTVFLKLVHDFLQGDFKNLVSVCFDKFYLQLEEGALLTVTQTRADTEILYSLNVKTAQVEWLVDSKGVIQTTSDALRMTFEQHLKQYVLIMSGGFHMWLSSYRGGDPIKQPEKFSQEQWLEMWSELVRIASFTTRHFGSLLIGISRLGFLDQNILSPTPRIEEYARQLWGMLSEAIGDYGRKINHLRQTLSDRLLSVNDTAPEITVLKQMLEDINQKRLRYEAIGLLEKNAGAERFDVARLESNLSPVKLVMIALNAQDDQVGFEVLEPIAQRVERFLALMNSKLKNKSLQMEHPAGLVVRDRHGVLIPLVSLSTGEQHLFVLLYDLIFVVQPDQLVLIDEPEAGMHISWQREFVDDLLEIIQLNPFDVILATHSPSIINDHSNLMVAFKAGFQQEAA
jgi:ABC-type branched-subunit amino acid transport system ATPase component